MHCCHHINDLFCNLWKGERHWAWWFHNMIFKASLASDDVIEYEIGSWKSVGFALIMRNTCLSSFRTKYVFRDFLFSLLIWIFYFDIGSNIVFPPSPNLSFIKFKTFLWNRVNSKYILQTIVCESNCFVFNQA